VGAPSNLAYDDGTKFVSLFVLVFDIRATARLEATEILGTVKIAERLRAHAFKLVGKLVV
jgi:hypothetical protein